MSGHELHAPPLCLPYGEAVPRSSHKEDREYGKQQVFIVDCSYNWELFQSSESQAIIPEMEPMLANIQTIK